LDETYDRTLKGIDEQNWEFAHRLFQCVAVASRPLLVEELAELLAFDFDSQAIPNFLPDWRPDDPGHAVLSTCSSLFSIVDTFGHLVIQFSHFSVKEYLMSDRLANATDKVSRFYVSIADAHAIVARACLGCLLHLDEKVSLGNLQQFPLAEYAARNWVEHVRFEDVARNMQDGLKRLFDESRPHFAVWVWIYDLKAPWRRTSRSERPCQPKGSSLHYAVLCGLEDIVKFLVIERSQDVNSRGFDDNETPLAGASREGRLKVAEVLLELGAKVDALDRDDWTPLHVASAYGHEDIAQMLLEHGADARALDNGIRTPLHRASERGHLEVVRVLIDHGADTNAGDKDERTPLHRATQEGHVDVTRALLEHGADVMARDKDFWTPLDRAASRGDVKVAEVLLEHGADATAKDDDGYTPLHVASVYGYTGTARVLLKHGAYPNAQDLFGRTPLHRASIEGYVGVAQVLLEYGADAKAQDILNRTPLHRASEEGYLELARVLLQHEADVEARDKDGKTPLHWASERGHLSVARLLLEHEHGADPNARDDKGQTALHLSSRAGHLELVRLLLRCGADVQVWNNEGRSPFEESLARGWDEVMQLLWEHGSHEYAADGEIGLAF
jgi:ankyrin repeat protein